MILKMGKGEAVCGRMQIRMQNAEMLTQEQIQEFLKGSRPIEFAGQNRTDLYEFVQRVLVAQEFAVQGKKERGTIRAYLNKVTGLSEPQMTRLIRQYRQGGVVEVARYGRRRFATKYTSRDVALLAEVDRAHGWLSGPATLHVLKREHEQFGKDKYAHLAEISVAHLYNLRGSAAYRRVAANWQPTRPRAIGIGERRKPDPQGRPGFLRIDTVHQGDWEGAKGVYHINAVAPVLEAVLHQFPFRILGFHSDNGSEYVNYEVERLLRSLLIEFTKSRANQMQDNALV